MAEAEGRSDERQLKNANWPGEVLQHRTALLAHVSCAITGTSDKAAIIPARRIRFMDFLLLVNLP
jgi:hypothetical protein